MFQRLRGVLTVAGLCGGALLPAPAQDALRYSLAGQDMEQARKEQLANAKFNVELGPVSMRLQSSMGVEATDNVKLTANNTTSDLIFRPKASVLSVWPISEKNQLSLSLGVGYAKYVRTTDYDGLALAPDSDVSFDLYVEDFVFNFHDRFSYSQDVTGDPTISGIGSLERFENVAGVTATWDLNKAVLSASFDYDLYRPTQSEFSYQEHTSELFTLSAGFNVRPTVLAGLEFGGGMTHYSEGTANNSLNDNQHVSAGPFALLRLSEYLRVRASAGYVRYFFDAGGTATQSGDSSAIYANLTVDHRVNASLTQSLSAGRNLQTGLFSETVELIYVRHQAQWRIFRKTSVTTTISYDHTNESGGNTEISNRYGFGLMLSRSWTEHLSSSLGYDFYRKLSDVSSNDYTQNRLVLDLTYAF